MTTTNAFSPDAHRPTFPWGWLVAAAMAVFGAGALALRWLGGADLIAWLLGLVGLSARAPWYFTRAAGTVGYLLLTASTVWGLVLSSRIVKEAVAAPIALAMHNILSWLAIWVIGFHALALLLDGYYTYTPTDLLVPFVGPYRPGWVGAGIIAFYLMVITSASFGLRGRIGQRRWRQLHMLTFVAFVGGAVHGLMAGTDIGQPGMQMLYAGSAALVLFLTLYRLLTRRRDRSTSQPANRLTNQRP